VIRNDIDANTHVIIIGIYGNFIHNSFFVKVSYVNIVVGVMDQDMLAPEDKLKLLVKATKVRIDNFDLYFEKLERNELEKPFMPKP